MVDLLRRIDRERFRPLVGCLARKGPLLPVLEATGIPVVEFPIRGKIYYPRSLRAVLQMARFMRREEVQIVHTQDLYSHIVGVPAALIAQVPVIVTNRLDLGHTMKGWHRWALKGFSFVLTRAMANSEGVRRMLIEKEKLNPKKIELIYNGVDLDRFGAAIQEVSLPLDSEDRPIGIVANLNPVKGHETLLQAAVRVAAVYPAVKFFLIGTGMLRPTLEARVRELGIEKQIVFLGSRRDVPQILSRMEISVLPSLAEGFSNAILESMAAGLPVVATDVGGNREAIIEGETGYLVPSGHPDSLANRILCLLGDRALARQMGEAGRKRIETCFSLERMVKETEQFYDRLLQERVPGAHWSGKREEEMNVSEVKLSS